MVHGCFVSGIHFARIVPAKTQATQLFIGKWLDELQEARVGAEKMFADVGSGRNDELLVFAVHQFAHALHEQAFRILLENRIPLAAPENLDDVPSRAAERGFELLNNLAAAADGPVEPLQVAVDDEYQIVEL